MKQVTFYTKENCQLCEEGLATLKLIQQDVPMNITMVDIYKDDELLELYQLKIPVITDGEEEIDFGRISYEKLRKRFL
jgi:glutaredoxin